MEQPCIEALIIKEAWSEEGIELWAGQEPLMPMLPTKYKLDAGPALKASHKKESDREI